MKKPTLAVHGAYFHENYGDILLVYLYARWVRRHAPHLRIVLPKAPARATEQIGADARGMREMQGARGMLLTGGGYLGEPPVGERLWRYRSYLRHGPPILRARREAMPHAIIGAGAGPVSNLGMRKRIVQLCQEARVLALRDEESARFMRDYGVTRPIEVTADAALTLTREDIPREGIQKARDTLAPVKSDLRIGVHLDLAKSVASLQPAIARDLQTFQSRHPEARLICFFDGKYIVKKAGDPGDLFRAITKDAQIPPVFVPYDDPWELTALLDSMSATFTTKLHVGIVSTALGRDVLSIPAHPKTQRFYRQTGQPSRCIPPETYRNGMLSSALEDILDGKRPRDSSLLEAAKAASRKNESMVIEFLRSLDPDTR